MTLDRVLDRIGNVRPSGNGYVGICPAHDDRKASLGITENDDGAILLSCYAGCQTTDVVAALGIEMRDLFSRPSHGSLGEPERIYLYRDEAGKTLFEAVRFPGKKFRQRHHDPADPEAREDGYVSNLEGVRRVLYRLPELLASTETVYICEGEKDVEALVAAGKVATCNPMGAGKWKDDFSPWLAGRNVIIVADRDEPGRNHAQRVRESVLGHAARVWIVHAKKGKDAYDHLAAGFSPEEFVTVREKTKRGIATARELADSALLHLDTTPDTAEPEYVIRDFGELGKRPLAFRNGRLYTLGGYTGDGKTSLALQITRRLCEQYQARVGLFTLEMTRDDLINRLLTHWGLPLSSIEHPWTMTDAERVVYRDAAEVIGTWPLEIIYDSAVTADSISETTVDQEYDFVVIDHIHRTQWGTERRKLESEIVRLTNLALEFNIPVLVLAQLRRFSRGQGMEVYPKPTLQDFRETEVLGTESSMALAIWRQRLDGTRYDPSGMSELLVLKNRHGPTGGFLCTFDPELTMFTTNPGRSDVRSNGDQQEEVGASEEKLDWLYVSG